MRGTQTEYYTMRLIILLGAPGSGKGTTAGKIRERLGAQHLSTGDMLRAAVKEGSPAGKEAEDYMKKGDLVPDEVIVRLVRDRLDRGSEGDLFLLDGFPRTVRQAELLEQSIAERDGSLSGVIFLDAPRAVLIERLTGRRICRDCGMNFHVTNVPPRQEGVCDACGGELYQRPDDHRETIENRLDVYARQTEDLIARYRDRGILTRVDSSQGADQLAEQVAAIVEK